jgi:hypothetical protein
MLSTAVDFQATSLTAPSSASTPEGTCKFGMNSDPPRLQPAARS